MQRVICAFVFTIIYAFAADNVQQLDVGNAAGHPVTKLAMLFSNNGVSGAERTPVTELVLAKTPAMAAKLSERGHIVLQNYFGLKIAAIGVAADHAAVIIFHREHNIYDSVYAIKVDDRWWIAPKINKAPSEDEIQDINVNSLSAVEVWRRQWVHNAVKNKQ